MRGDGVGGALGGVGAGPRLRVERGGVRVEPEDHLAATVRDRLGQPVREGLRQLPLTFDLSPAPAENFGDLPPGMVIRSPVRGLTPWRGPRSVTWNLPKPVKLTSSPLAERVGDPVEHRLDGLGRLLLAAHLAGHPVDEVRLGHLIASWLSSVAKRGAAM